MLAVTCASWAGVPNVLEGKWGGKIGLYYYYIENGLAVVTNKNMSETGSASGAGAYDGIVRIPETITFEDQIIPVVGIQDYAFYNCPELTKVIIPNSIATMGEHVFSRSTKLDIIEVDKDNNYFYSEDGILFSKSNEIVAVPLGKSFENGLYEVPTTITGIWNYAFDGCTKISKITLPTSLEEIGHYAFGNCSNLEDINIPANITSLGNYAFYNCSKLATDFTFPKNIHEVPQGIFYNCYKLKNVKFHNSTTSIATEAFYGCTSLTTISLPQSLTRISPKAFFGAGLTSITIPGSIKTISSAAFASTKLTSITINEGVQIIDQSAFSNITNPIQEVSFPESITNINDYAFSNTLVQNYYVHNTSDKIELGAKNPFLALPILKIHVFQGLANEFKNAKNWSNYKDYIVDDVEYDGAQDDIITLIDGVDYTNSIDKTVKKVIYSRVYKNTNWQALYLPFDMSYDDWKDNFEIAIINNIHQYDDNDDGNIDRTTIEVLKVKDGKTIKAHTPCVIKALKSDSKNAQTIIVNDATLKKAESKSKDCTSVSTRYTFTGIYSKLSGADMVANHLYGMAGGTFNLATDPTKSLGGYRWYLEITGRDEENAAKSSYNEVEDIDIICLDEAQTTNINSIANDSTIVAIYDMNGRMLNSLQKGMNIVKYSNGVTKKIIK